MTITNHGTWTRYAPEVLPEGLPATIMFCKRDEDGVDWYEFANNGAVFTPNSIKITIIDGKVAAATRDASRLFPQACTLLEITGDNTTDDVQASYGDRVYDATTNTLSDLPAPPPPLPITRRQLLIGLLQEGFITSQEAIDSARGVGVPAGVQEVIDELPTQAEKDAATITWYAMSQAEPGNQLVILLAAKRGMTSAQIDDLFRQWILLKAPFATATPIQPPPAALPGGFFRLGEPMTVQYLHGIETIELDSPSGPVETVKSNVIGLVGTAPDADPDIFPLNTPVPVFADALKAGQLKSTGTLLDGVDAIYSQKSAVVVVVRVSEGESQEETWSNCVGSPSGKTGIWSLLKARPILGLVPKLLVAPGHTSGRPSNGVSAFVVGDVGDGYVLASTTVTIAPPAAGGRQATAVAQVVGGKVTGIILTDPGYGYDEVPAVTINGAGTGAAATANLGHVANPVGVAMASIVDRLRAVAFLDGPGTSYEDAVSYRGDYGSQRISIVDPGVLSWDTENSIYVTKPASAYAAGIQARIDEEKGFWYSFSNELIQNIGGPARPVDFMPNDRDCEANMLNSQQITTIIHDDGFRFWGLRGTGTDPLWAQISVRRTADMVYESLERAERSRLDKPFSLQLLSGIQGDVNKYLRLLRSRGALIGGKAWIDPTVNTAATFANGELTVDFDLEPPACLEHLQFRASRNPDYYNDFIEEFTRTIASNA